MLVQAFAKVGSNKGRPRVWLDGKRLDAAGFTGGTRYFYRAAPGRLLCSLEPLPDATGARKVTGRPGGKPIMDITGSDIVTLLGDTYAVRVCVTFDPGKITIEPERTSSPHR